MNAIQAILKQHYGLDQANITPQKGGWAALAYRVSDNERTYFLKVYEKSRTSTPKWTALIDHYVPIMIWLAQHSGLRGKIPVPLLTHTGHYKCEDADGIYLLYEYIVGETVGEKALTSEQVRQLSEIVAELHSFGEEIPLDTDAIKEQFDVPFLQPLKDTLNAEYGSLPNDIREAINPHIERVNQLIDRVERLAASLKNSSLNMALCHTDLHNWNMMQAGRQLILIDWEGLRLAPVEADMMFLVDKPYYDEFMSDYRKRHSHYAVHPDALQFYQDRRVLEDIWEFMEQLLFDEQEPEERADTIKSLTQMMKAPSN